MKLTNIVCRQDGPLELIFELDGVHYEAERFQPGTDAVDLAGRLRMLAARIEQRTKPPYSSARAALEAGVGRSLSGRIEKDFPEGYIDPKQ